MLRKKKILFKGRKIKVHSKLSAISVRTIFLPISSFTCRSLFHMNNIFTNKNRRKTLNFIFIEKGRREKEEKRTKKSADFFLVPLFIYFLLVTTFLAHEKLILSHCSYFFILHCSNFLFIPMTFFTHTHKKKENKIKGRERRKVWADGM